MVYQDSLETEGSLETLDQSESKASSDILVYLVHKVLMDPMELMELLVILEQKVAVAHKALRA